MVEIIKIERSTVTPNSTNFFITFKTDLGDTLTIERNVRYVMNEKLLYELIWNRAKEHDFLKSFNTQTKKIQITRDMIYPEEIPEMPKGELKE